MENVVLKSSRRRSVLGRTAGGIGLVAALASGGWAQTIDDGLMMKEGDLCAFLVYGHNSWESYWEGLLKRTNGNIGTVTTQSVMVGVNYGVTNALNVIVAVPGVWTEASAGTLSGMSGLQDLTMAAKYRAFQTGVTGGGRLRGIAVLSASLPASDYNPDFLPMSIGLGAKTFSSRATLDYVARSGWFVTATAAYTWRGNVTLDRDSYYADGQLYLTNEVRMPNVFDYAFRIGYRGPRVVAPISISEQRTLGGGDIRRQDMPFVSYRMNAVKVDAMVKYAVVNTPGLEVLFGVSRVIDGRNVGQSTTLTAGAMYTFHLKNAQ